jgi:hypothetical protein
MSELLGIPLKDLTIVGLVLGWALLSFVILPRLGVPT